MYPYRSGAHGTVATDPRDLLSVVRDGGYLTARYLAAAEQHAKLVAEAGLEWELRQAGLIPTRSASIFAVVRQTVGAACIRAGRHLQGAPRTERAAGAAG